MKHFISLMALLLSTVLGYYHLQAVPAYPYPVAYTLPDGTTITVTLRGDEFASWAETTDGYTLLRNTQGYFEYAVKNTQGDLVLSGMIAKNISERTLTDNTFLSQISKKMKFSSTQVDLLRQLRQIQQQSIDNNAARQRSPADNVSQNTAIVGMIRTPLILVEFPNKPFSKSQIDFNLLCNQVNYSIGTATGSVHDYFVAASYNQLDFQVDVFGPYTLAHTIDYYDRNSPNGSQSQTLEIIVEATALAQADGCNFSDYDANDDGKVDGIHLIYAGYDQSAGAPVGQSIWATAWSTTGSFCSRNGKAINRFSMSSELRNTSGSTITPIGVICHELSHVFGLPDLYDTDYSESGGQSIHLGSWDIMASGSWNNDGDTPPFHSAWCRDKIGWVSARILSNPAFVTLPNPATVNPLTDTTICRINTQTANEYFLVENRQKQGWDAYIPSSGMLIYHVDENAGSHNSLGWRDININPDHRGLYVKQAGGGAGSASSARTTDPYPQPTNNQFTDNSIPNSKSWAGANTSKPVTNITHNIVAKTVTFNFMTTSPNDKSITTLVNPANSGTTSGDGIYTNDSSCTVVATANAGYDFVNWTEGANIVSSSASYTFTVLNNRILTANFETLPIQNFCVTCPNYNEVITPTSSWQTTTMEITALSCMVYKFSAMAGEQYTFKTGCGNGASANFDTQLYLYNSSCSTIASNDDGCENNWDKIEDWYCPTSGDYYLKVNGYSNYHGTFTLAYNKTGNELSNDATLSNLTVNQGALTPIFNTNAQNYSVLVAHSVTTINISATATHTNATVAGTGNKTLNVGQNPFDIIVTAEDGTTQITYTIVVTRENPPLSTDATLSNLTVNHGALTPIFNTNAQNYSVLVVHSVTTINISATATHTNATVAGTGNKTLNVGQNSFDIIVTAEDGTTQITYIVVVTRDIEDGIAENVQKAIRIYPNPAENELHIENPDLRIEQIEICDILGKNILKTQCSTFNSIDISMWPSGIYLIKIQIDKQIGIRKFVKK